MILIAALIVASGAQAQSNSSNQPMSEKAVMKKGLKGDLTGHADVANDVALGTGQIDLPAVLKAARRAGVKWYFIEDESPTAAEQIPLSLRYLEQVKF